MAIDTTSRKDTIASTAIGAALNSVAATAAVTAPDPRLSPTVVIVAASVTDGATLVIEGKSGDTYYPITTFNITANGSYAVPLYGVRAPVEKPDTIRINCIARTDGTYTGTYNTLTKG